MISQRVIVLSALVALFALLSTADAQQQLRANNKRVLLEQEIDEDATFWGRELGSSSKSGSKSSKSSGSGHGSGSGKSSKGSKGGSSSAGSSGSSSSWSHSS
eukprot:CAMPEP_0185807828 /NCGR_PEP_ID=MMETSP1322-20130828/5252_1 /TAXON_ID=265543 /ORGANISM="Minutocellus polymorphus, Strain RCC2270" /LENGTH=101 /DNA_ID=CAMNT_0028504009 /DNA_START=31 /DNA_END=336 /DNA_ORIENTATION=-